MNLVDNSDHLRHVGKKLQDQLTLSTPKPRIPSPPQEYAGQMHEPEEVLRVLRGKFRTLCGLPAASPEVSLAEMEIRAIFALCYWIRRRFPPPLVAVNRRSSDYHFFTLGEGLPDYVLWVHTQPVDLNQIPSVRRSYYATVVTACS